VRVGPGPVREPPPPFFVAIEVFGGVTLRTLVSGVVVAGVELLATDGGVAAVVCAVTVWGVISGGACGVVIGVVVMVSALTGGGAGGGADALDSRGRSEL